MQHRKSSVDLSSTCVGPQFRCTCDVGRLDLVRPGCRVGIIRCTVRCTRSAYPFSTCVFQQTGKCVLQDRRFGWETWVVLRTRLTANYRSSHLQPTVGCPTGTWGMRFAPVEKREARSCLLWGSHAPHVCSVYCKVSWTIFRERRMHATAASWCLGRTRNGQ
jgi:hypothetical protein